MCKIMEDLCKEAQLNILCDLVWKGRLTLSEAAEESGLSEDEFREAMRERYPDWRG